MISEPFGTPATLSTGRILVGKDTNLSDHGPALLGHQPVGRHPTPLNIHLEPGFRGPRVVDQVRPAEATGEGNAGELTLRAVVVASMGAGPEGTPRLRHGRTVP